MQCMFIGNLQFVASSAYTKCQSLEYFVLKSFHLLINVRINYVWLYYVNSLICDHEIQLNNQSNN